MPALALLPTDLSDKVGWEDDEMARANLDALVEQVGAMQEQIKDMTDSVRSLDSKVQGVVNKFSGLERELQIGQHPDPLPTRMRVLEHRLNETVQELKDAKLQRWQVWLAVLAGVVSLLVQVVAALLSVKH